MLKIFLVILVVVFVVLLSIAGKQNKKVSNRNNALVNKIKNRDRYDN